MDDLKELKDDLKALDLKIGQLMAKRDRIDNSPWRGTKRLLSVSITNLETSTLYLKEAIHSIEKPEPKRYG